MDDDTSSSVSRSVVKMKEPDKLRLTPEELDLREADSFVELKESIYYVPRNACMLLTCLELQEVQESNIATVRVIVNSLPVECRSLSLGRITKGKTEVDRQDATALTRHTHIILHTTKTVTEKSQKMCVSARYNDNQERDKNVAVVYDVLSHKNLHQNRRLRSNTVSSDVKVLIADNAPFEINLCGGSSFDIDCSKLKALFDKVIDFYRKKNEKNGDDGSVDWMKWKEDSSDTTVTGCFSSTATSVMDLVLAIGMAFDGLVSDGSISDLHKFLLELVRSDDKEVDDEGTENVYVTSTAEIAMRIDDESERDDCSHRRASKFLCCIAYFQYLTGVGRSMVDGQHWDGEALVRVCGLYRRSSATNPQVSELIAQRTPVEDAAMETMDTTLDDRTCAPVSVYVPELLGNSTEKLDVRISKTRRNRSEPKINLNTVGALMISKAWEKSREIAQRTIVGTVFLEDSQR